MVNKKIIQFAAGFGLSFVLIHIVYIFHLVPSQRIVTLYSFYWQIFFGFVVFSIVYIIHHLIMKCLTGTKFALASSIPFLINIAIFGVIYVASLVRG